MGRDEDPLGQRFIELAADQWVDPRRVVYVVGTRSQTILRIEGLVHPVTIAAPLSDVMGMLNACEPWPYGS